MDGKYTNGISLATKGIPLLLDGGMVVGYVYGVPMLVARFQTPSWFNGTMLISAYVLLLIAIYAIRELDRGSRQPPVLATVQKRGCLLSFMLLLAFYYIVFCTALFVMLAPVGSSGSTIMLVLITGVIGALIAFKLKTHATVSAHSLTGLVFQMIAVLGVNVITLMTLAVWQSPGFDLKPRPRDPYRKPDHLIRTRLFLGPGFLCPTTIIAHHGHRQSHGVVVFPGWFRILRVGSIR